MVNTDTPFFSPSDFNPPSAEVVDEDLQKQWAEYIAREGCVGKAVTRALATQTYILKE